MKITLVNHGTASEWGGGDSVQIKETAKRLKQRGYEVSIQNSDRPDVKDSDLVHIFNCRVAQSFLKQISTCQAEGKKVIVSPIWISIGRAIWGSRGSFSILLKAVQGNNVDIKNELIRLKERTLEVEMEGGTINSDGRGTFDIAWQKDVGKLLGEVDGLLPNSWLELKSIQTDMFWKGENYEIAHYGVDSKLFLDAEENKFREYSGIKGPYIMQAGRIEAGKNQAMLCWALRNTNIKIVLIGSSKHWPAYAQICKEISGDKLTIIDHLPQDLLASAYAGAKVHCLASWMDTCGLVSLEAGLSGTPLVGSTFGHELEYLKNEAWLADPGDEESIKNSVLNAWDAGKYNERSVRLKKRILSEYNWENTVDATERLYKRVIENA